MLATFSSSWYRVQKSADLLSQTWLSKVLHLVEMDTRGCPRQPWSWSRLVITYMPTAFFGMEINHNSAKGPLSLVWSRSLEPWKPNFRNNPVHIGVSCQRLGKFSSATSTETAHLRGTKSLGEQTEICLTRDMAFSFGFSGDDIDIDDSEINNDFSEVPSQQAVNNGLPELVKANRHDMNEWVSRWSISAFFKLLCLVFCHFGANDACVAFWTPSTACCVRSVHYNMSMVLFSYISY